MALELIDKSITMNGIAYGACNTPMNANWINNIEKANKTISKIPLSWIAELEEIARFVRVILEDFSDYATGSILNIDGGKRTTTYICNWSIGVREKWRN